MSKQRKVYYRLVTRDGLAYADTDADCVMCSPEEDFMDLVNTVHSKNSAILSWCTSTQLKVHPDSASLNIANGALLKESALGERHGNDKAQPLLVVVPSDDSGMKRQRLALNEQVNSTPCLPPDSQRIDELLPSKTFISKRGQNLHFVNREQAMLRLLDVHCEHFDRRSKEGMNCGGNIKYPLIDNLFGMGKSRFCQSYLALVARYIAQKNKKFGNEERAIESVVADLNGSTTSNGQQLSSSSSGSGTPTVGVREKYAELRDLLGELHEARTLYVKFELNSLSGDSWETKFVNIVRDALGSQWKVNVPDEVDWRMCLKHYIQKPVFFVFDEIGKAFAGESKEIHGQRKKFFIFVEQICEPLSQGNGIFYILSGRARFLWTVGIRSEDDKSQFSGSPGEFVRIHLNPIGECYIREILENTFTAEQERLIDFVRRKLRAGETIDSYIRDLYARTGGHPRAMIGRMLSKKESEFTEDDYFMTNDVQTALDMFPNGIKSLFERRNNQHVDLTGISYGTAEKPERFATFHYLAGRIHAGYDKNLQNTKLVLPPPVERILCFRFLPFLEYVLSYKSIIENEISIDRSRVFEEIIIKWFQSVFTDKSRTVKQVLGVFCPQDSKLSEIGLYVDPQKCKNGLRILSGTSFSGCDTTISTKEFATEMSNHFSQDDVHVYFPAPKSVSPDFFVIPSNADLLIGVQVKCRSKGALGTNDCIAEATKFYATLGPIRSTKPGLRGVLVMCASCKYTDKDFPELTNSMAISWGKKEIMKQKWENFEIIIMNLSGKDSRADFFLLAMPLLASKFSAEALDVIERIIG